MGKKSSPRRRRLRKGGCSPTSTSASPERISPPSRGDHAQQQQQQQQQQQYIVRPPQPHMKQVKLHPSGCQQWSSQIVTGGGVYMAYASTLTTYVYDVRDFSLVTILGGNDCNVHSILWHPTDPHRVLVLSTNGRGSEWDVRSEERVADLEVGAPPACSAWDPSDPTNLAVVSRGANETYLMRNDEPGRGRFRRGYTRRSSDESLLATCTKWSQYEHGVLVSGWTDGRVSFSETSSSVGSGGGKGGKTKLVFPSEDGGSVVDLRHDPNRGPYVLIGYKSGTVVLWDASGHCSIATFDRCTVGLVGIRWMAWAPGNFLALSSKTGVGKVFNISQKHPIGTVKLGETGSGVRDAAWLPAQQNTEANGGATSGGGPRAICGFRDGSLSVADAAFRGTGGQVGGGGGSSSGVGSGCGAIPWASKAGHIETVFSCEHRPGDPDTLATGSYGSSVKVWHVPTMDLKVTLTGQTGAIYCVAWSLDGDRIASSSGKGTVWLWDVETGKDRQRIRLHSRAVHRVQWDPFNDERLASVSADKSLVIFSDKGAMHRVYVHPDALFGCSWCPTQKDVIATGCKDGTVRVFDCSWEEGLAPQYVLFGHTQRVFHVCWSPLLDGTLASGSDDASIMVWSLHRKWLPRSKPAGAALKIRPSAILRGHTSNVRPLHWNSEVPWLLLSGSWDGTVRAWDVRKAGIGASNGAGCNSDNVQAAAAAAALAEAGRKACIAVMSDHVADVYGLSASPSRPFCYASVSRDTTLRVFNLEGVVSSIKSRAIINISLSSALSDTAGSMLLAAPTALCGTTSRLLETHLRSLRRSEGTSSVAAFRKLFDFFWGSDGVETFWEMIRWVDAAAAARASNPATGDDAVAPRRAQGSLGWEQQQRRPSRTSGGAWAATGTSTGGDNRAGFLREVPKGLMCVEERVVHRDARRASDGALARLLSSSPTFIVQDRRLGRSDRLERASRLHLAAGDLRSSCEALIALGRWQTALSLAPGVGMEYWRAVADRYVEVLLGGAEARDRCVESAGGSGGQAGSDLTALATALLSSTGRPMDAVRDVLRGSEEALSLAAAVADGAYPPRAQLEPLSSQATLNQSVAVAHAVSEEKEADRRRVGEKERRATERVAIGGRAEEGGCGGAKLLTLIDDHMEGGGATEGRGRTVVPGIAGRLSPIDSSESKGGATSTSPSPLHTRRPDLHQRTMSAAAGGAAAGAAAAAAAQRGHGEAMLCSITESKAEAFFQASQPALAAAAILSICDGSRATAAPALAFLIRGEEPELAYAAATALKFPAREVAPLVREMARRAEAWGDSNLSVELLLNTVGEDEICNSFGRGHHTGGNNVDGNSVPRGDNHNPVAAAADGGYWAADVYGACGEDAGPRGAAMVVTRATTTSSRKGDKNNAPDRANPCPSLNLRSRASYLEDAAAAAHRGMDIEAVRLLVLGGDLEQASELGVSFLRENVPILSSFPPPPVNKSALAVVRALGSGSDGGLPSNRVSARLRMEVLAYASYVGAIEAIVRGYNPVVAPLLRTASTCVQATERMDLGKERGWMSKTDADEKNSDTGNDAAGAGERSRSPSPGRRRSVARLSGRSTSPGPRRGVARASGKSTPPRPAKSSVFPACMSAAALALATIQHLTMWSEEQGDARALSSSSATRTEACTTAAGWSPHYALEVELGLARRVRDEENILSGKDAKALDDLLSSADHRAATVGTAAKTLPQRKTTEEGATLPVRHRPPRTSTGSTDGLTAEAKSRSKTNDSDDSIIGSDDGETEGARGWSSEEKGNAANNMSAGGRSRRRGERVLGNDQPGGCSTTGNWSSSSPSSSPFSPWRHARGEIVVSGSRLPSCRRHERVAWRTQSGDASGSTFNCTSHTEAAHSLATSSLEFGREMWPRPRGAAFLLEDEETVLGLNEAVMWSKVNPFSPLNTGCRIIPF